MAETTEITSIQESPLRVPALCNKLFLASHIPVQNREPILKQNGGPFGLIKAPEIMFHSESDIAHYDVPWQAQREYIAGLQSVVGGWRFRPVDFSKPPNESADEHKAWFELVAQREWPVQLDSLNPGRESFERHDRGDHIEELTLAPPKLARLYQAVAQATLINRDRPEEDRVSLRKGLYSTNRTQHFSSIGFELDKMTDNISPTRDTLERFGNADDITAEVAQYKASILSKTEGNINLATVDVDLLFDTVKTCSAITLLTVRNREPTIEEVRAATFDIIDEIARDAHAYKEAGLFPVL